MEQVYDEGGIIKADRKTEAEVVAALNKLSEGYTRRDMNGLLALLAPDPDVFIFGTGADERRVGLAEIRAQFERDWSQSEAASFQWGRHSVSAAGPVAWVAADVTFKIKVAGEEVTLPGRMTGVLEKRGDRWLIAQAHFSLPAGGQAEGQSWPT